MLVFVCLCVCMYTLSCARCRDTRPVRTSYAHRTQTTWHTHRNVLSAPWPVMISWRAMRATVSDGERDAQTCRACSVYACEAEVRPHNLHHHQHHRRHTNQHNRATFSYAGTFLYERVCVCMFMYTREHAHRSFMCSAHQPVRYVCIGTYMLFDCECLFTCSLL